MSSSGVEERPGAPAPANRSVVLGIAGASLAAGAAAFGFLYLLYTSLMGCYGCSTTGGYRIALGLLVAFLLGAGSVSLTVHFRTSPRILAAHYFAVATGLAVPIGLVALDSAEMRRFDDGELMVIPFDYLYVAFGLASAVFLIGVADIVRVRRSQAVERSAVSLARWLAPPVLLGPVTGLAAAAAIVGAVVLAAELREGQSSAPAGEQAPTGEEGLERGQDALERIEEAGGSPRWHLGVEFEGLELAWGVADRSVQYWDREADDVLIVVLSRPIDAPDIVVGKPCSAFRVRGVPAAWMPREGLILFTGPSVVLVGASLAQAARALPLLRSEGGPQESSDAVLVPPTKDVLGRLRACAPPTRRQRSLLPLRPL